MIDVLLVKVFVPGLHLLILSQINRAVFRSISKPVTFFRLFVGQKTHPKQLPLEYDGADS